MAIIHNTLIVIYIYIYPIYIYIRDSFISGLHSPIIRQRLIENYALDLQTMFDQARPIESAQKNSV